MITNIIIRNQICKQSVIFYTFYTNKEENDKKPFSFLINVC